MTIFLFLVIGMLTGTLSGLLGIGGGVIVVPSLIFLFEHHLNFAPSSIMHMAAGTSLAIMVFTSMSSAVAYHRRRLIIWPLFWRFLPGLCTGMLLGWKISLHLSNTFLTKFFSLFLVIIGIKIMVDTYRSPQNYSTLPGSKPLPNAYLSTLVASVVGILSMLFGTGGGILMVPFFLAVNLNIRASAGTSAILGVPIALLGTLLFSIESSATQLSTNTLGYVYWPAVITIASTSVIFAPLGASLAVWCEINTIKRIFTLILFVSAWKLF